MDPGAPLPTQEAGPSALERALGLLREVRAAALPADDEARRPHACALCARAVAAYWRAACAPDGELGGLAPSPVAGPAPDGADAARAAALGEAAAALPPVVAAYLLGTAYTALLPPAHRSRHGVFFTPPPLVDRLLDLVEEAGHDWTAGTVLDPACGGGAFLAPVAMRMAAALERGGADPGEIVRDVSARLAGVEIDPFSAWMARVFLEAALWPHCLAARLRVPPEIVEVRDALGVPDGWRGGFALVVGNPPYGRLTLAPEVRERFRRSLFGHANLYGLFTDLAVRLLAPGGGWDT